MVLHVVEFTFSGGFESLPLRQTFDFCYLQYVTTTFVFALVFGFHRRCQRYASLQDADEVAIKLR